ncbi:MAG: selenocysteine-specific translation elongation factor [Kouleothrix sp.]
MYVIGTAGHVDHGKSTLVKTLTGIDPDRWEEERRREMTIDLGFAWLTLPSGRSVSIIDVPGHERFIKNMLAGVGAIDAALLVVAADEALMPQTEEHLAILDLLGIERGLVVLTKADLVDAEWLGLVGEELRARLAGTSMAAAPQVIVSARSGQGIAELLAALVAQLDQIPPRAEAGGAPRMSIDRSFTIGGFGAVVTGTLLDGPLRLGDEVEIVPTGLRARVRGLQTHQQKRRLRCPARA